MAGNADYFRRLSCAVEAHIGLPLSLGPRCLSPACTGVSQGGEGMRNDLFSWTSIVRLVLFLLPATLVASAQTVPRDHPSNDAEKIADALRAGPRFHHEGCNPPRLADYPRRGISRPSPSNQ